jgi:hypothetical protein
MGKLAETFTQYKELGHNGGDGDEACRSREADYEEAEEEKEIVLEAAGMVMYELVEAVLEAWDQYSYRR